MREQLLAWWLHLREVYCARREFNDAVRELYPDSYAIQNDPHPLFSRIRLNAKHFRFLKPLGEAGKVRTAMALRFITKGGARGIRRIIEAACRVRRSSSQANTPPPVDMGWGTPCIVSADTKKLPIKPTECIVPSPKGHSRPANSDP